MGVFDDDYDQAIIDAARQPAAHIPSGFLHAFNATSQATRQEGLSISERQNYLGGRHSAGPAKQTPPTVNQSLSQLIKNSGGVSIGAVKRSAGKSPDELALAAHEAVFIDEPDPAVLAERLRDDLSGNKVRSIQSDTFERKLDLEIDREFQAWAEAAEKDYLARR